MEANVDNKRFDKIDWHYILIANGFVSSIVGIATLFVATLYSQAVRKLIIDSSLEEFTQILRLVVLMYIAYGLVILSSGLIWLSIKTQKSNKNFLNAELSATPQCTQETSIAMISPSHVVYSDPDILGGTPVFVGTRVELKTLLDYLEAGNSMDEFLDHFPSVSREQAIAALELTKEMLTAYMPLVICKGI